MLSISKREAHLLHRLLWNLPQLLLRHSGSSHHSSCRYTIMKKCIQFALNVCCNALSVLPSAYCSYPLLPLCQFILKICTSLSCEMLYSCSLQNEHEQFHDTLSKLACNIMSLNAKISKWHLQIQGCCSLAGCLQLPCAGRDCLQGPGGKPCRGG